MRFDDDAIRAPKLNAFRESLGAAFAGIKFHVRTLTLDTALTDLDGAQSVSIAIDDNGVAFPANARPISAHTLVLVPVAGPSLSALTVQIGDAADIDEMMVPTDLFGRAALSWTDAPGIAVAHRLEGAAYVPLATYQATGANVADVTGQVVHVICYYKMLSPYATA